MNYGNKILKETTLIILSIIIIFFILFFLNGCSLANTKNKISYIVKTEPEKAVIDFIDAMGEKKPEFIYDNLLTEQDKNNISREKFIKEFNIILNDIDEIKISKTVYLGYEKEFAKTVAEFNVKYVNGEVKDYKKYIYLKEENKSWKIVFEKTFF
ncbi:hypothetical protein LLG07_03030 [bacterium]|nr:hypothetical protein [bacterium]